MRHFPLAFLLIAAAPAAFAAEPIRFNRDIRPILSDNCFACHGPDTKSRKADLRLDTKEGLFQSADGGQRPVTPRDPAGSELLRRVLSADPDEKMPPPDSGRSLTPEQIDTLRRWITEGAKWEGHWSFQPVRRPPVPATGLSKADPLRNPIDAFIAAGMERMQLAPVPTADPRTLARRLSIDLVGLPILEADASALAAGRDPIAYERLVDRLLASPAFGERIGMYWLDLVRYGDSGGYHSDGEHFISSYRDYVIAAFNENLPFDRFTREQLAGDLIPNRTLAQHIATGYNRLNKTTEEGGAQAAEYLVKHAADRVRTTSGAWLGLTIGCAECHDHKYDPISTADFYRFSAYFADVDEVGHYKPGSRPPEIRVPTREQAEQIAALQAEVAALRGEKSPKTKSIEEKLAQIKQLEEQGVRTMVTVSVKPRETRILPRGNWLDHSGPAVTPAVPAAFQFNDAKQRAPTRLQLADWIVDRQNPLTARVLVNRLWKQFFGVGISRQLDDVGIQGEWPVHPELLDWLAAELVDSGWNVKHVIRLMVTSQTYRRSSRATADQLRIDPTNRYCARQSSWRMDAELIRDHALALSGLLVARIGGPSVKPYQPDGYWDYLNFPMRKWKADSGPNQYRRGLYTHWQRTFPHPAMLAFDAPSREECTAERPISNTPKAALVLLNDPSFVEAARSFAARVLAEGGSNDAARIVWAWRTALARDPAPAESAILAKSLAADRKRFAADPNAAEKLLTVGLAPRPRGDAAELAAWTEAARALFNLHESITRD